MAGAAGATLAIGVVDYAFPAYLSNISTIAGLGTSLVFIVIVLIWFYALAIIILAGAETSTLSGSSGSTARSRTKRRHWRERRRSERALRRRATELRQLGHESSRDVGRMASARL